MADRSIDATLYACVYRPPSNDDHAPSNGDCPRANSDRPLVAIAAEFSPRYEQHRADLMSIDVRGLSRLLGTPQTIGDELRREAAARGVRVHVAVAPSRTAALLLALARPGVTVVTAADQAATLATIPLGVLERLHEDPTPEGGRTSGARLRAVDAQTAIAALKRWGLRSIGELAALPADALSARLGRAGLVWQSIARGEDIRPLVPMQPEERFESTMELEWPIEGAEPLSFVLTRLLEPLSTRLERRDRGAAVLHVALRLVTGDVHACRLELPSPLRDVRALRTLALLDVDARPPAAAIDAVTITIEPTPGRIVQHTLFTRPRPTPEQLSTLVARLGALMGQDRIGSPAPVDSCRPGAFTVVPFATDYAGVDGAADPVSATRDRGRDGPACALRRCRQPVPARVAADARHRPLRVSTERRGFASGAVVTCAGPWRTSGAWWEEETPRNAGPWTRDEWDVALADGTVYRVFRDRATDGWFIDGVVD